MGMEDFDRTAVFAYDMRYMRWAPPRAHAVDSGGKLDRARTQNHAYRHGDIGLAA